MLVDEVRKSCAWAAARARHVAVAEAALDAYAAGMPAPSELPPIDPSAHWLDGPAEQRAAFWLTLNAVNFGSGWFPTIRKRPGRSGYFTIAGGIRDRFAQAGGWSAAELERIEPGELAAVLGQDAVHPLMRLFADSLRDLGAQIAARHASRFLGPVQAAAGSAAALVEELAGWTCFADASRYDGRTVQFLKRAQVCASDLDLAGVASFDDLARLTLFADNLVPHVLRLDGVLVLDDALVRLLDEGGLLEHGSEEEVELRACAVHAAELLAARRPDLTARDVDQALWSRGAAPRYKAVERPRCRCTAY